MSKELPPYQKLDVRFAGEALPADGSILFEAQHTRDSGPGPHVTVQAGRLGTWVVEFVPGNPLPTGAEVAFRKLENQFRFAWRHQDYWPRGQDYVTVEDSDGTALPFECETVQKSAVPAIVTLPRDFAAGEKIVLRMGDRRSGGPGSSVGSHCFDGAHLNAGVRLSGDGPFRPAPGAQVMVTIVPCPPIDGYYLFAPSDVRPGNVISATALPTDINGNAMSPPEDLQFGDGAASECTRTESSSLRCTTKINGEGLRRLELRDVENGITTRSNPVRVSAGNELSVYWGEFHCHGYDADEINVLDENTHPDGAYRYGRDATGLDFCAMSSHIFRRSPDAVDEWWELYREAARKYDEEGRYVTMMGCEWRDAEERGGDRNIIWRDLDAEKPDPTWRIDDLYARFGDSPVMITPHVGGAPATPHHHDPDCERLCEMVSGHGNFEWFAQAYLSRGHRLGLIGGSDGHKCTPGHPRMVSARGGGRFLHMLRQRDSGWTGGPLLAVMAENLDRESLWRAFQKRRTYASTGARALLDFRVNGSLMGSEIEAAGNVTLDLSITGTAPIARVDLIRDQHRLKRWRCDSMEVSQKLVDSPPDGDFYYYLRIEQVDGEFIWSSPVWVKSRCGGTGCELPAWNQPESIDLDEAEGGGAEDHLDDLLHYLEREERAEAFSRITPRGMTHAPMGSYAVFLGYVRGHRIRIHWFYEFEKPRIRLEAGWDHYGTRRIHRQDWARPLFEE